MNVKTLQNHLGSSSQKKGTYKHNINLIRNFQSNHHGFPILGVENGWNLAPRCRTSPGPPATRARRTPGVSIDSFKGIQPTKNETWPRKDMCHWMCGCVDVFFHGTVWHFPENRETVTENMSVIGFALKVSISLLELGNVARKWYACTVENVLVVLSFLFLLFGLIMLVPIS